MRSIKHRISALESSTPQSGDPDAVWIGRSLAILTEDQLQELKRYHEATVKPPLSFKWPPDGV